MLQVAHMSSLQIFMHKLCLPSFGARGKMDSNESPVVCSPCTSLSSVPQNFSANSPVM